MAWTNLYEAHHLEDREKKRTRKGDGEAPLTKTNKKPLPLLTVKCLLATINFSDPFFFFFFGIRISFINTLTYGD